jgi:branched-chain amino acid aminotransferase
MTALTFIDGDWHGGNPPLMGAMTHAAWMASVVFDGARAFENVTPDLDRHCQRVVDSCHALGLEPILSAGEIEEIARDGVRRFAPGSALYIRPMFFAESSIGLVLPDPESTRFALVIHDAPMPDSAGFASCLSPFRRPGAETAPTGAKASCHYPNSGRAIAEARQRGFANPLMLDALGHVAEFATSNIWIVRDGVAITPAPNGSFLAGITRQRLIGLLRNAGVTVVERTVSIDDVRRADEIFSSGNYGKVQPVIRFEDRAMPPGPVYRKARELYWDFAHSRRAAA